MGVLRFPIADATRIAKHSLHAPGQMPSFTGIKGKGSAARPQYAVPTEPSVLLVHDEGVYLMSNGTPPDLLEGTIEDGRRFVAYAEGCHPIRDSDSYDAARDLVGGDDFSEVLPWAKGILRYAEHGATHIVVRVTSRQVALSAVFPRRRPVHASSPRK